MSKVVPVTLNSIRNQLKRSRLRARNSVMNVIIDFMNSEHEAVEITWDEDEYKSAWSAYSSYAKAIKRTGMVCTVAKGDNCIYLCKQDLMQ